MSFFSAKPMAIIVGILAVLIVGSMFISLPSIKLQSPPDESKSTDKIGQENNNMEKIIPENGLHTVTLKTNYGVVKITTYDADAPKTVNNFITLAEKGYYNDLTFHRVINGFMIQGGDPNCASEKSQGPCGTGGPGYKFEDELNPATESYREGYKGGVVAMANAGPNTNGSQFFIMHKDYPLPNKYTIFGKVIGGMEVVDTIASLPTDGMDKPLSPVIIKAVGVEEKIPKNIQSEKTDLIRLAKPQPNEVILSPFIVEGEARGFWFFEASFPVKIFDETGAELGVGIAQAQSEWMTENFVPFKAVVEFKEPSGNQGELILEKDNPSGLQEHADELRIPIRFK